jgi:hypothetical protein
VVNAGLAEPLADLTGSDMVICRQRGIGTRGGEMEFRDWIGCDVDALDFRVKVKPQYSTRLGIGVQHRHVMKYCIATIRTYCTKVRKEDPSTREIRD